MPIAVHPTLALRPFTASSPELPQSPIRRGKRTETDAQVGDQGAPKHLLPRQPELPPLASHSPLLHPIEAPVVGTYAGDGLDGHFRRFPRRVGGNRVGLRATGAGFAVLLLLRSEERGEKREIIVV